MSKQTLKFNDIEVNKKEFYDSKQAIPLNSVNAKNIVISHRVKHNDNGYEYFIGYLHDDVVRSLCIILPQMSGYIKYFESGGKNMSFKIENESVYLKYNEIWNKIKSILNVEFPIYDDEYIKTKVKTFNNTINTLFSGYEIPKERNQYICISAICIDSVLRVDKKNYLQVYLEQCKYKIRKRKLVDFIDDKVDEIPKERIHYICIAAICIDSVLRVEKKDYPQVYLEQCKYKIKRRKLVDFIDDEVDLSSDDSGDLDE